MIICDGLGLYVCFHGANIEHVMPSFTSISSPFLWLLYDITLVPICSLRSKHYFALFAVRPFLRHWTQQIFIQIGKMLGK